MAYFIQTSNEDKVVRLDKDYAEVVENTLPPGSFNLVNNLKTSALADARAAAKEQGLRLKNSKNMAFAAL